MTDIVILDFGSQTTHLIQRRLKNYGLSVKILDGSIDVEKISAEAPKALILSGGPSSVYAHSAVLPVKEIYSLNIPILGICYGLQIISHQLGGKVIKGIKGEYGLTKVVVKSKNSLLFKNTQPDFNVWMSHFDQVVKVPHGFNITAQTDKQIIAAAENAERKIFCVQFHPEVVHTAYGDQILSNFLTAVGLKGSLVSERLTYQHLIREKIKEIKNTVASSKIVCALSGGVDSTTAAVLAHKAIGNNLLCLYVDTGFMRLGETEEVEKVFQKLKLPYKILSCGKEFISALKGVINPEEKRRQIGKTFIMVIEKEVVKHQSIKFLMQGTIYPDVIESQGTKHSRKIKTHHNVAGLPKKLKLKLIEPFRELYKDEVRLIAKELKIPLQVITRHVFPGPGMAVRIIGEVTTEKLTLLKAADHIVTEEFKKHGIYKDLWMGFAILAGIKTTGVVGDERIYGETIAIRAVTSKDTMTADWAKLPYPLLARISSRIVSEVPGVARVVYDITSKPPATMEWE